MSSIVEGYNYDIFISYRQKDNKYDGWVTEFVDHLEKELEATFKDEISVYFDINPHDGLLETHDVDASLKDKLKCLVFIPIISQTYCDSRSFAWQHEFVEFNKLAKEDQFGRDIRLSGGNVANRILPIKIHDLDPEDKTLLENELGRVLRCIEFIYKSAGVNRPLRANEDHPQDNLNKTYYRDQINKVANAVKEIITALKRYNQKEGVVPKEVVKEKPEQPKKLKPKVIIASFFVLALIALGYFFIPKIFKTSKQIEKSIAVLPFINDSPNDSNQYFINGFMEDVLNHLQTIKDLHPISRTSAEKYRKTTKSIPEIAKELSVNYIIEGDMQRYGNSIRISVNLFKVLKKEIKLWGKTYEKKINDATDIFSLQSQIAQSIATELEAVITPQEKLLIEKTQTSNLSAYENCILGLNYVGKFTKEDFDIALNYFEKAIEIDPDYADAYLGIAQVWMWRVYNSLSTPEEATPIAKSNLTKAFKLDSTSAEAYSILAEIQMYFDGDFKSAEESIEKSISLNPNNTDAHMRYGNLLGILGHPKEALVEYELALKLDPMNKVIKINYGVVLYYDGKYNEAIKVFQEVLKTDPGNVIALDCLPVALHVVGRYSEELEAWKADYSIGFKGYANVFDQGYANGGITGALNLEADSLVKKSKTKFILPGEMALLYACAGNKERTLDMLEWDYEVHDPAFVPALKNPIFEFVHDEPRYQNLFHKINLPYKP
ncbi:MAG: tetratricopeptide repeat protein [Bacteroidales bacterium]|jgi:TolB-like protein/lipoprotein NlpI